MDKNRFRKLGLEEGHALRIFRGLKIGDRVGIDKRIKLYLCRWDSRIRGRCPICSLPWLNYYDKCLGKEYILNVRNSHLQLDKTGKTGLTLEFRGDSGLHPFSRFKFCTHWLYIIRTAEDELERNLQKIKMSYYGKEK